MIIDVNNKVLEAEEKLDIKSRQKKEKTDSSHENNQNNPDRLSTVGFVCQTEEPTDQEVCNMVDEVIAQVLGPVGLAAIIKPGDKVVIKVNLLGPNVGKRGEKGRAVITDPRIVRYVAEKVREIIGFDGTSDLKVVDTTFYNDSNPSLKSVKTSFYWARLERNGDNVVDDKDICYDGNGDGFLDGASYARLVNLDSFDESHRDAAQVKVAPSEEITVCLPKLLRTHEQVGSSDEYCDVLIGLPVFKSHGLTGITGALKLHYGFRHGENMRGDTGRLGHDGMYIDTNGRIHHKQNLLNYICAEHLIRTYDLVIMDCLTGNRQGPRNPGAQIAYCDEDVPVDYILTNAIMASRDPVAIDTVEAVLAGYDPSSIGLLETAHLNGLGNNKPEYISLCGLTHFGKHRKTIYDLYHPANLYPFPDGFGGACLAKDTYSPFSVNISKPDSVKKGVYSFKYLVQSKSEEKADLVRVELWINQKLSDYKTHGDLEQGKFVVDLSMLNLPKDSYLLCYIIAWDRLFNCAISQEIIFMP